MSNKLKNRRIPNGIMWSTGREFFGYLLDMMICIYMLLVIIGLPFYFQKGFLYIGTEKANFFRQISVTGARFILPTLGLYLFFAWMENRKEQRNKKIALSVTDKFALLYGAALLVSYVGSDYRENALWGADGWFMGLFPQLFLLAIYFLVSRFWEMRKWMLVLFGPVSAAVFVLGYLNRFGIFPINMLVENVQFISTIGNINWYCGYLVSVLFGACYLLWQSDRWIEDKKKWKQMLLSLYVAIGFATLVTQGSMSGLFTLAVILVVIFCLSVGNSRRMLLFGWEMLLLSLACLFTCCIRNLFQGQITYTDGVVELLTNSLLPVVMAVLSIFFIWRVRRYEKKNNYPVRIFIVSAKLMVTVIAVGAFVVTGMIIVNTMNPGNLGALSEYSLFTFSPTWGSNRGATWRAGFMCFAEQDFLHKIIGVGPDCMSAFLHQDGSAELQQMVSSLFGTFSLTNAHNEWITALVNTGILGLVGFVGMMVSAIMRFIKCGVVSGNVILGACGFCLLAYTVNNMFSFQQTVSTVTIFLILGIGEGLSQNRKLSLNRQIPFMP